MSMVVSKLDQGHEHVGNASDYYARGLLVQAAEEHYMAAEAFKECVSQSTDEHTKETLRKLCNHHFSVGADLQRRIARLREEGKDPSLPQLNQAARATKAIDNESASNSGSGLHVPHRGRNLDSSATTFDESFMVLNQQSDNSGEDSPFDLFWKVTGEIMYNLSQPMSFQSAALAALDAVESRTASGQSNAEVGDAVSSKAPSRTTTDEELGSRKPSQAVNDDVFDFDFDEYDSLEDFYFVPSSSTSELSSSAKLKQENAELKSKLETMEKQISAVRRQIRLRNEQDQHLRDNIMLARKEAQRAMAASAVLAPQSVSNIGGISSNGANTPTGGKDREIPLLRRLKELEEELRLVRSENEKQKAMIAKFRERWERLKESAKKKKLAKANAAGQSSMNSGVGERIEEDPEGEAAAEFSGKGEN